MANGGGRTPGCGWHLRRVEAGPDSGYRRLGEDGVHSTNPNAIVAGGDWSTYRHNGRTYQSDIYRGLFIWRLDDDRVGTFHTMPYLNPQTSEFTID